MLRKLIAVFTPLLGAALTLAAVFLLLYMTGEAELMENPLRRTAAIFGTLIAGILLLLGSVYICTKLAVLLFARPESEQKAGGPAMTPR